MARPTRDEALATLEEGGARASELLAGVGEDDLVRPATIGEGDWSAKDLIGHVATWEELAVQTLEEFRGGVMPWVERPEGPFSAPATGKVDAFNARTTEEKRAMPLPKVLDDAHSVHGELIGSIRGMTDHEWNAKAFYETPKGNRRTLVTLLGSILGAPQRPFGHAFAHLPDLEAYVRSLGG
jgi:hypothetical protein